MNLKHFKVISIYNLATDDKELEIRVYGDLPCTYREIECLLAPAWDCTLIPTHVSTQPTMIFRCYSSVFTPSR